MKQLILPKSVRAFTVDHAAGSHMTLDAATIDSAGAFLMSALEAYDPQLYKPLVSVNWYENIDLRTDVSLGNEVSSFGRVTYGANPGTSSGSKKAWISGKTDALPTVSADIAKQYLPLTPWGVTCQWSVFELAASALLPGASIDQIQLDAMNLKWNMDTDEQVYIGDSALGANRTGLINNASVAVSNAANGASGSPLWTSKTPDEMLADVNGVLTASWQRTGYALFPNRLLLPPAAFSYLVSNKVSTAGNISILKFLQENNLATAKGLPLEISFSKWNADAGVGGTGRLVAYTKQRDIVRFPMVPLQRTPLQIKGIFQSVDYYGKLGLVEFVRPEVFTYLDGITAAPTT